MKSLPAILHHPRSEPIPLERALSQILLLLQQGTWPKDRDRMVEESIDAVEIMLETIER